MNLRFVARRSFPSLHGNAVSRGRIAAIATAVATTALPAIHHAPLQPVVVPPCCLRKPAVLVMASIRRTLLSFRVL